MDSSITSALMVVVMQIPIYITWIAGIILAIINIKKMPKASILTLISLIILLISNIISTFLGVYYPIAAARDGISYTQISIFFAIEGVINILIVVACWVMLLIAIFGKRAQFFVQPIVIPSNR